MRRKQHTVPRDMRVTRRSFLAMGTVAAATASLPATAFGETKFKRIPVQYIAALADPDATAGDNAQAWDSGGEIPVLEACTSVISINCGARAASRRPGGSSIARTGGSRSTV